MSRTEELRKKFAQKGRRSVEALESPRGRFVTSLHRFTASQLGVSSEDEAFENALFARFEAERPADLEAWPACVTHGLFRSVGPPPVWVGEPDWAYHEGRPLEFVAQVAEEDETVLYIFRGMSAENRAFYVMRAWSGDSRIHLDGRIGR